jgi:hypothetical protein
MVEQEEGIQVKFQQNKLKLRLRKIFTFITTCIGIIAVIVGIIVGCIKIIEYFSAEPDIKSNFARYKVDRVISYSGELINVSSHHAEKLTLKGKFNSEIIDLVVNTNDSIEKNVINNPIGSVEFGLTRLSRKSKCKFDIIVGPTGDITEDLWISWGKKGALVLDLQKIDENIARGVELREKVSDSSRKARQKWLENNAKNIRK